MTSKNKSSQPLEGDLKGKVPTARRLGVSIGTLDTLCRDGKLTYVRVGNQVRFRDEDVTDFIERNLNIRVPRNYKADPKEAA